MTGERTPIPVIGGGWAGCAAALALARAGHRVALYEAAATLGGRARRVVRDGLPLDNGQHLLLGAYAETRRSIELAHDGAAPLPLIERSFALVPLSRTQGNALTLRARALPSPFDLAAGLLLAHELTWRERIAALRWFTGLRKRAYRCAQGATVAELLAPLPPRVAARLWSPLCVAALNTAPERASAQMFANVLRAVFDGEPGAGAILAPALDLGALFPDAVARWLEARGHAVHLRAEARIGCSRDGALTLTAGAVQIDAEAMIVAVGPHQLARVFDADFRATPGVARAVAQVERLAWEPIVTTYLGYAGVVALPAGLVRLDDAPGQWVFDRGDILMRAASGAPSLASLLAVVISASGAHETLGRDALVAAIDAQLRRLLPVLPALKWSQVITETRATYACTPQSARPAAGRLANGLYLAGDYTDHEFPATLEAAVRSGRIAAAQLSNDLPP